MAENYEELKRLLIQRTRELESSEARFRNIISKSADAMIIVDCDGMIRFVNPAAEELLNRSTDNLVGSLFGFPLVDGKTTELDIIRHSGDTLVAEMRVVETEWDGVQAFLASLRDITDRKRAEDQLKSSLSEKEVLLKEVHHRVKNNLQVISSLLMLQSRHIEDSYTLELLAESQNRIRSMALIHEKLYQSKDLSHINFSEYIQNLVSNLCDSYELGSKAITQEIRVGDLLLGLDTAIPCGMIINELVSNSLKHAFPNNERGTIHIELNLENKYTICLTVSDTGVGFPPGLDFHNTSSLGLRLVCTLVEQLGGTIELCNCSGTSFKILFKEINSSKK